LSLPPRSEYNVRSSYYLVTSLHLALAFEPWRALTLVTGLLVASSEYYSDIHFQEATKRKSKSLSSS
jgi:hypothetical protein